MDEHCYKCNANVSVVIDGVEVGKRPCRNKFTSTIKTDTCPKCFNKDVTLIPKAFLVLWDTNPRVRAFVTERMDIRSGLDTEGVKIAQQIIDKYGKKKQLEYSI